MGDPEVSGRGASDRWLLDLGLLDLGLASLPWVEFFKTDAQAEDPRPKPAWETLGAS